MSPRIAAIFILLFLATAAQAAQQCLVIGDSLTKEYEVEFPALFPNNPESWDSRNWIEILHQRRTDWFDTGPFAQNNDPRIIGHEYNWAFPGATAQEIKDQLNNPVNKFLWVYKLENHLKNIAERVVIFAGGNDVDSYYGTLYNGTATAATTTNVTRDNIKWIVDYVRSVKPTIPIVLISVPHLGCAPDIQLQHPTDAVKTARVTAAMDALNADLAAFATLRGIGFVPGVYDFTKAIISPQPFVIDGIEFYKQADLDARPRYIFSGDGFHPNTVAHARIAQLVIEAFKTKYPATQITSITDNEIVTTILGLTSSAPFNDWIATQNVPVDQRGPSQDPDGDGIANGLEFLLEGYRADTPNTLPKPTRQVVNQSPYLALTYKLRTAAQTWATLTPQSSTTMLTWANVPAGQIIQNPDGTRTARVPVPANYLRSFLRLGSNF